MSIAARLQAEELSLTTTEPLVFILVRRCEVPGVKTDLHEAFELFLDLNEFPGDGGHTASSASDGSREDRQNASIY
jgi:hypothetical protein